MFLLSLILFSNFVFSLYFLVLKMIEINRNLSSQQEQTKTIMKYVLYILLLLMLILYAIGTSLYLSQLEIYVKSVRVQIILTITNIVAVLVCIFLAFSLYFDFEKPNDKKSADNTLLWLNTFNILLVLMIVWLGIETNQIEFRILNVLKEIKNRSIGTTINKTTNAPAATTATTTTTTNATAAETRTTNTTNPPTTTNPAATNTNLVTAATAAAINKASILKVTKTDLQNISTILGKTMRWVDTVGNKNNLQQALDINTQGKKYHIYIEYLPNGLGYFRHALVKPSFFKPFVLITRRINWSDALDSSVVLKPLSKERAFLSYIFIEYNLSLSSETNRIIYEFTDADCFNKYQIVNNQLQKFGCVKFKK